MQYKRHEVRPFIADPVAAATSSFENLILECFRSLWEDLQAGPSVLSSPSEDYSDVNVTTPRGLRYDLSAAHVRILIVGPGSNRWTAVRTSDVLLMLRCRSGRRHG